MKVSVCITTLNEGRFISSLLDALLLQSKKPDEIVIVDACSTDNTIEIIKDYQKKSKRIKLIVKKCSRAEGRNLGIALSKNEIIAITDAGCVPKKDWLKKIVGPLKSKNVDISAGFYRMLAFNSLEKAFTVFLGTDAKSFGRNYLPATRSIAFKKEAWRKVGGFPERLKDTAEDTVFNYKCVVSGLRYARVKDAQVDWKMPSSLSEFSKKIFKYAKGDAESGIWLHPLKGFKSHNIKALLVVSRYLVGILITIFLFKGNLALIIGLLASYFYYAFRKVYVKTASLVSGIWGVVVQIIADFCVMAGFMVGLLSSLMMKMQIYGLRKLIFL